MNITSFYYKKTDSGICILRCRSLDTAVVIPKEIDGLPVTELGSYVFSEICRNEEKGVWDCGKEPEDLPGLWGNRLTELTLPDTVQKVGRYYGLLLTLILISGYIVYKRHHKRSKKIRMH